MTPVVLTFLACVGSVCDSTSYNYRTYVSQCENFALQAVIQWSHSYQNVVVDYRAGIVCEFPNGELQLWEPKS